MTVSDTSAPSEWPTVCDLTIPGDPQSKGRPRVYHGHGITPQKTRDAENRVYTEWRRKYADLPPYDGPVSITITFWMATRQGRDWDNLAKLLTDALNGVAYMDDRQIIDASVHVRRPDQQVIGVKGRPRKRKAGDPLTWHGREYTPHTEASIYFEQEYTPR